MSETDNKPRLSPEKAAALTVAFTLAGSGIASAQEQDPAASVEPTTEPNPLSEYCDIPTYANSDSQELSNGDIVVFESPAPDTSLLASENETNTSTQNDENDSENAVEEELSSFDKLTDLLFNQEEYPDCDWDKVYQGVIDYYKENKDQVQAVKEVFGKPADLIKDANKEMAKEKVNKRKADIIVGGLASLILTYSETGDPEVYTLIEAYAGATHDAVSSKQYDTVNEFVLDFLKDDLERLDKRLANEKLKTQEEGTNTSEQPAEDQDENDTKKTKKQLKKEIVSQPLEYSKKKDIGVEDVSLKELKKDVRKFLNKHKTELDGYLEPLELRPLNMDTFNWLYESLEKGAPWARKSNPEQKKVSKYEVIAIYINYMLDFYQDTNSTKAREDAFDLADKIYDHGVSNIDPKNKKQAAESIKATLNIILTY